MSQAEDVKDIKKIVISTAKKVDKTLELHLPTDDDNIPLHHAPRSWAKTQQGILEMQRETFTTIESISKSNEELCKTQVIIANTLKEASANGNGNPRLSNKHKAIAVGGLGGGAGLTFFGGVILLLNMPESIKAVLRQLLGGQ